ncbi:MAG: DEAD/DEAH box helicase family protein [Dehalobacter sp.]|nr:DEAD/DEAH box helicase family protein [Dehalobacter sp.]
MLENLSSEYTTILLFEKYNISTQLWHEEIYSNKWHNVANSITKKLGYGEVKGFDFVKLAVFKEGCSLFSGKEKRDLRARILKKLEDSVIDELYEEFGENGYNARGYKITELSEKNWHDGGRWARKFVSATGFPEVFAGLSSRNEQTKAVETINPKSKLSALKEYQVDLKNRMKETLCRVGNNTRCMVTLPTGGGKTRIAVEAFIEWLQPRFSENKYLIWIAQSEELCEQAVSCIKEIWSNCEFTDPLRIYRYFGGKRIPADEIRSGGAVIASISQLHRRIESGDEALEEILKNTGAMIIDEAHRAVTYMYNNLFDEAKKLCGEELFPVCGLTATPGRNNIGDFDTQSLVNQFEAILFKPNLGVGYDPHNPLKYFKDNKYLAKARHEIVRNNVTIKFTESEIQRLEEIRNSNGKIELSDESTVDKGILRKLALDDDRNQKLVKRLLEIPKGSKTLVYACTVEHGEHLSAILNYLGRKASAVSSKTDAMERRGIINVFKEGDLEFIFNYGVLTTGFDAPKTDHIVLCRPIMSDVLYEQIVGRGMRGPAFNGTEWCTIIDCCDTIERMGLPLAYERFSEYWINDDK